ERDAREPGARQLGRSAQALLRYFQQPRHRSMAMCLVMLLAAKLMLLQAPAHRNLVPAKTTLHLYAYSFILGIRRAGFPQELRLKSGTPRAAGSGKSLIDFHCL